MDVSDCGDAMKLYHSWVLYISTVGVALTSSLASLHLFPVRKLPFKILHLGVSEHSISQLSRTTEKKKLGWCALICDMGFIKDRRRKRLRGWLLDLVSELVLTLWACGSEGVERSRCRCLNAGVDPKYMQSKQVRGQSSIQSNSVLLVTQTPNQYSP
jgi:hypothetical protein